MSYFILLIVLVSGCWQSAAAAVNETAYLEPLFLDLTIQQVATNTSGMPVFEPWASDYIEALREGRYGDAIWARYHIGGRVREGIVGGTTNTTVLESIEEDAVDYRVDDSEYYTEAMSLYASTSPSDSHAEILDLLSRIGNQDIDKLKKRITYSINCSRDFLARRSDCTKILNDMGSSRSNVGNIRSIHSFGTCNLRVGPHGRGADVPRYKIRAVGILIEDNCGYVPPCCRDVHVSGYSPQNSGHRKICLSSKDTGCS